ncbi:MAG: large-conductance mechanosensitive channel protein MscL [Bacteroidales bacterium]|jgi:large conductance mechanosensitive channel|nr:large-conductance mechanosensitive channel protein MscL [Bacteroidales bacterium]
MSFVKEFKEFAMKGNLVDMAIAFVMGGAFGKVVSGFIDGLVMPIVGKITAGVDFQSLKFILSEAQFDAAGKQTVAEASIKYGQFITIFIDFLLVAFFMFLLIKAMNKMKKKQEAAVVATPPAPTKEEVLLTEIRDLLKK